MNYLAFNDWTLSPTSLISKFNRCCKCNDLTGGGVALLVIGIIVFWPIALIPCFMADCKNKNQIPIYGYPA